jgi:excisionase family DNA binding protein
MVTPHKEALLPLTGVIAMTHMVTAAVVAQALQISEGSVYKLGKKNELPFETHKFGRSVRFKRVDVEAFVGRPLTDTEAGLPEGSVG